MLTHKFQEDLQPQLKEKTGVWLQRREVDLLKHTIDLWY